MAIRTGTISSAANRDGGGVQAYVSTTISTVFTRVQVPSSYR
jgi:hypothetical protein